MGGSYGGLGLAGVADLPGLGEEGRGEPAEGQGIARHRTISTRR